MDELPDSKAPSWTKTALLLLLFAHVSAWIVFAAMARFDMNDKAAPDNLHYVRMYQGAQITEIEKPFRYRVGVPYLARLVPKLPESIASKFDIDANKLILYRFGVVNLIGLTLAAFFLYRFLDLRDFYGYEPLLGVFLFLTSFFVSVWGGVPLVDTWSYLFLALCCWCLAAESAVGLFLAVLVGMFFKETTFLALPLSFMIVPRTDRRWINAAICLVAAIPYLIFRFVLFPTSQGYNYSVGDMMHAFARLFIPSGFYLTMAMEAIFAFGFLLVLGIMGFLYARREKRADLLRLCWLIPITFVVPVLIDANLGRIWFLSFPAVIPLSLLALRAYVSPSVGVEPA